MRACDDFASLLPIAELLLGSEVVDRAGDAIFARDCRVGDAGTFGNSNGDPGITYVSETGIHPSERMLVDADADAGSSRVGVVVGRCGASRDTFNVVGVARSASWRRANNGTRRMRPSRCAGVEALADAGAGAEALGDADADAPAAA